MGEWNRKQERPVPSFTHEEEWRRLLLASRDVDDGVVDDDDAQAS